MDKIPANANSTAANTGNDGNGQLAASFQQAISAASETLSISVSGQAQLNALRARPN